MTETTALKRLLDAIDDPALGLRYDGRSRAESEFEAALDNARRALEPCPASISHGPGHQSTSPCVLRGDHDLHRSRQGHAWRGNKGMTGFFDESPLEDE